jgi:hypothetical protein
MFLRAMLKNNHSRYDGVNAYVNMCYKKKSNLDPIYCQTMTRANFLDDSYVLVSNDKSCKTNTFILNQLNIETQSKFSISYKQWAYDGGRALRLGHIFTQNLAARGRNISKFHKQVGGEGVLRPTPSPSIRPWLYKLS